MVTIWHDLVLIMDQDLNQCLSTIPGFVDQLEAEVYSTDLNLIEWLIMRAELLLELLRVLSGKFSVLPDAWSGILNRQL